MFQQLYAQNKNLVIVATQILLITCLIHLGFTLGFLSWVFNGDTLIFFLQAKVLLSGDGIGLPRTVAATYYFPELLIFKSLWLLGIKEPLTAFIIFVSFQVIIFNFCIYLLLRKFCEEKNISPYCIYNNMRCCRYWWRGNAQLVSVIYPGIHVSALWMSMILIWLCAFPKRSFILAIVVFFISFVMTLSDRFTFLLFAVPTILTSVFFKTNKKTVLLSDFYLVWIGVLGSVLAFIITPILKLSDIQRGIKIASPSDYFTRLNVIWSEVIQVKMSVSTFSNGVEFCDFLFFDLQSCTCERLVV